MEQNICLTKIANVYFVYDLDSWPKIPHINFPLKIVCLERLT